MGIAKEVHVKDDNVSPSKGMHAPVSRDVVMETLQQIVMSEPFVKSPRSRDFLAFVVTETVAGRGHRVKERTVARRALARPDTFDARSDAAVRVQAGRVRAALDAYYEDSAADCQVRISLPKGTYVPTFTPIEDPPAPPLAPDARPTRTLGPGVAVVVLETADDEVASVALARGITDSLVRALTRFPGIRVVGPVFPDEGAIPQAGEGRVGVRLGVQYVLRGTVRTANDVVRVTASLIDAASSEVVWSDSLDTPASEVVFNGEDDLARQIAGIVADYSGVLLKHAARSAALPSDPVIVTAMLRYYEGLELNTPDAGAAAQLALDEAIAREPDNPQLLSMLASTHAYAAIFASGPEQGEEARRSEEYARAALAIDPENSHAHLTLGMTLLTRRHLMSAQRELQLAIDMSPANPSILYGAGWYLALAGDWDCGVGYVRESTRLNPTRPTLRYALLAVDRLLLHDYAAALVDATRYGGKDDFWGPLLRALALHGLGYVDEARDDLAEARALNSDFRDVVSWWPDFPEGVRTFLVASIDDLEAAS
jgi:TolB-like protein